MTLIEKAAEYVFKILTLEDSVKYFPKEYLVESARWIKINVLNDNPKLEVKINDAHRSQEKKIIAIETVLEDAFENSSFKTAFEKQLLVFEQMKSQTKNEVSHSIIQAKGNIHIGDKSETSIENKTKKNTVKNSAIKAGGDFRLGDDIVKGNQIINNYNYQHDKKEVVTRDKLNELMESVHKEFDIHTSEKLNKLNDISNQLELLVNDIKKSPPQYSDIKKLLKLLLQKDKPEVVIEQMLKITEEKDIPTNDALVLLSAQLSRIKNQESNRIISRSDASIERNNINVALTVLIDNL